MEITQTAIFSLISSFGSAYNAYPAIASLKGWSIGVTSTPNYYSFTPWILQFVASVAFFGGVVLSIKFGAWWHGIIVFIIGSSCGLIFVFIARLWTRFIALIGIFIGIPILLLINWGYISL